MDIKECYEKLGGNYDEVLSHLPSEKIIAKFALKFLNDKSFEELAEAVKAQDWTTAERSAHTLKGICQNLSFTELQKSSSALNEALKHNSVEIIGDLYSQVEADYNCAVSAINEFNESKN